MGKFDEIRNAEEEFYTVLVIDNRQRSRHREREKNSAEKGKKTEKKLKNKVGFILLRITIKFENIVHCDKHYNFLEGFHSQIGYPLFKSRNIYSCLLVGSPLEGFEHRRRKPLEHLKLSFVVC